MFIKLTSLWKRQIKHNVITLTIHIHTPPGGLRAERQRSTVIMNPEKGKKVPNSTQESSGKTSQSR